MKQFKTVSIRVVSGTTTESAMNTSSFRDEFLGDWKIIGITCTLPTGNGFTDFLVFFQKD